VNQEKGTYHDRDCGVFCLVGSKFSAELPTAQSVTSSKRATRKPRNMASTDAKENVQYVNIPLHINNAPSSSADSPEHGAGQASEPLAKKRKLERQPITPSSQNVKSPSFAETLEKLRDDSGDAGTSYPT